MKRAWHLIPLLIVPIVLSALALPALAQGGVFPLPAPLYILTTDFQVLRVDPETGAQTAISPQGQPVSDFDISPDGGWLVYRTSSNNAVVVSQIDQNSGYVLEFDVSGLPASSAAQTIAWAPDASALAYIVPEGVRIAEIGANEYGAPLFSLIQGNWGELYWEGPDTLIASDSSANATRISGSQGSWNVALALDMPARPQPVVLSYLAAPGVMLDNNVAVPGTAGALSFRWGPPLLPLAADLSVLPYDLYYLAEDTSGILQVWRQPKNGEPFRALTAEPVSVMEYATAPDRQQIAYVAGSALFTAAIDGSNRRELAQLQDSEYPVFSVAWSHDSTRLAFHDSRGLWIMPADASQPPLQVVANVTWQENSSPGDVRSYLNPQWSPDGSRLLVTVGYYEGSAPGIVDLSSGQIAELGGTGSSQHRWADPNRVITWASGWGYQMPGLYLFDLVTPNPVPVTLLDSRFSVKTVTQGTGGTWVALVAASAELGPQAVRVWQSDTLQGQFQPLYDPAAYGFVDYPQIAPPVGSDPVWVAGLRSVNYDSARNLSSGELTLVNASTGEAVRLPTPGRVWNVKWGS